MRTEGEIVGEGGDVSPVPMAVTLGVTWGQDSLLQPTCGPGVGESGPVSDPALGDVSLVGFDRNQPNHLNPELWEMQVVTVNINGWEGEDATATQLPPTPAMGAGTVLPRSGQGQASSEHRASCQPWHAHLILTRPRRLCWCWLFNGVFSRAL